MILFEKENEPVIKEKDFLFRVFMALVGFGLAVSGGTTAILYLNLLPLGYTFSEYVTFLSQRVECYFFPIGIIIITLSIYFPQE
ncbi:hypothetical protein [Neobacillus sp. LXY-4]|uniref:hypothetical protein n=1 Tax=Neobacillus sp. LXY-4 TaxID=3379826 RepID=UPI003EE01F64